MEWAGLSLVQLYLQVQALSRAEDLAHTDYEEGLAEENNNDVQRRLNERVLGKIYRESVARHRACSDVLFRRIGTCSMAQLMVEARGTASPGLAGLCRGRIMTRLFGIMRMVGERFSPAFYAARVVQGGFDVRAACRSLDEWIADVERHYELRFADYALWQVQRARDAIEPLRRAIEAFENERATAFMMAAHPRLGSESLLAGTVEEERLLRDMVAMGVHAQYK
jgi:hypothetical protein